MDVEQWRSVVELILAAVALLGVGWKIVSLVDSKLEAIDAVDGHGEAIKRLEIGLDEAKQTQSSMVERLDEIKEAIRPTNGDQRSISDRLDTVKKEVVECAEEIALVRGVITDHTDQDQHNFQAIADWSAQFKDFDPMDIGHT